MELKLPVGYFTAYKKETHRRKDPHKISICKLDQVIIRENEELKGNGTSWRENGKKWINFVMVLCKMMVKDSVMILKQPWIKWNKKEV